MNGKEYNRKTIEVIPTTDEQKHGAAQLVAVNSTSVADCAMLLDMLGLTPQDGGADITRALGRLF